MQYKNQHEQTYRDNHYIDLENVKVWMSGNDGLRFLELLNDSNHFQTQVVYDYKTIDKFYSHLNGEFEKINYFNVQANSLALMMNVEAGFAFIELQRAILSAADHPNDLLPDSFHFARHNKLFTTVVNNKKVTYKGFTKKSYRTYKDLPEDFVSGIRDFNIEVTPTHDRDYKLKAIADMIAAFGNKVIARPLTISLYGFFPRHAAPYMVRIPESGPFEILAMNSLPGYDDKLFIEGIKKGVRQIPGNEGRACSTYTTRIYQKDISSCVVITTALFAAVNPDQTLIQQQNHLESILRGVLENRQLVRRLIARADWWYKEIYQFRSRLLHEPDLILGDDENADQYLNSMKCIFKQLLYFACDINPPHKIDFPSNVDHANECLRFLNIFAISENDNTFLRYFNPTNKKLIIDENVEKMEEENNILPLPDERQSLIAKLNQYIDRVKSYGDSENGRYAKLSYKLGFKERQYYNRKANCLLAEQLVIELNNPELTLNDIFNQDLVAKRHQLAANNELFTGSHHLNINFLSSKGFFKEGIHSTELNRIIKLAKLEGNKVQLVRK